MNPDIQQAIEYLRGQAESPRAAVLRFADAIEQLQDYYEVAQMKKRYYKAKMEAYEYAIAHQPTVNVYYGDKFEKIADELAEALRLTREYVGEDTLPNVEGWSHYDALKKYREAKGDAPADTGEGKGRTPTNDFNNYDSSSTGGKSSRWTGGYTGEVETTKVSNPDTEGNDGH